MTDEEMPVGKKEAYREKRQAQLREWKAKIAVLKARADKAKAEQKIRYYETLEALQEKYQRAHKKLEALGAAGEDAWEKLTDGVEAAWQDLREAIERATDKFK